MSRIIQLSVTKRQCLLLRLSFPLLIYIDHRAFEHVEKYFLERNEGIIPTLYHLKRLLPSIYSAEKAVPVFNLIDCGGTYVVIR